MEKQTSVLINGGGPVGLVLANLLGKMGIKTIIIEVDFDAIFAELMPYLHTAILPQL